ncbi:MAG: hypothetical protein WCC37_23310, partial [Candidatus Sulfotelmatobacter sp.]
MNDRLHTAYTFCCGGDYPWCTDGLKCQCHGLALEVERLREELKIADARSEKIAGTAARRTAEAWEEERKRLHAALRAARPCVFNSRHGGWEEALRLVDEALREESRGGPAECR